MQEDSGSIYAKFFFHSSFATTATTIVSGFNAFYGSFNFYLIYYRFNNIYRWPNYYLISYRLMPFIGHLIIILSIIALISFNTIYRSLNYYIIYYRFNTIFLHLIIILSLIV